MVVTEDIWREYRNTRDDKIKHELVLAHLPLVKHLAARLAVKIPAVIDQEDLESYGVFGLLDAVEKYNPELGTSFKAYAYSRIRGAMIDEIRKLNWVPRTVWQKIQRLNAAREKLHKEYGGQVSDEMLAEAMGMSLAELRKLAGQTNHLSFTSLDEITPGTDGETVRLVDLIRDRASPDPLDIVEREDLKRVLAEAVSELSEKDQIVLSLYYQEGLTLKEISKVLEVSESRVCQLHSRAIDRLRNKLTER